jgi:uncharacterized protein (DUF433 family)
MNRSVINIDQEILGGTPVFSGTRVPVRNLFDYLEEGETVEGFLSDFPSVKKVQIVRLLEISRDLIENSSQLLHENSVR